MTDTADPILAGLDPQQQAAALHMDGPALIVAGAGAGKTTTLVRRTANLVRNGVDPSSILLLTFTRASAADILKRAQSFSPDVRNVMGGTFHSVASKLIRENHRIFNLPEGFTVLDPEDVDDTIKRLMEDRPCQGVSPRSASMQKVISFARNTQQSIEAVTMSSQFWKYRDQASYFAEIAKAYQDYKRDLSILDFDDLLEFWAKMAEHPQVSAMLRERFRYVMLDEFQDTNALQLRIVYGMGGTFPNFMSVGDPSQSIYAFRGAAPATMFDFPRRWPETKVYLIETNYRSTPEIVALADRVDRSMTQRFERKLVAAKPSFDTKPQIVHVPDLDGEGDWIVERILKNRDDGMAFDKQAVVVRSSRRARHVEAKLSAAGIPYKFHGGIKLHEAAHIKDIISVLRVATNPSDEPAWLRLLMMLPKIGRKTAINVSKELMTADSGEEMLQKLSSMAFKKKELALAIKPIRLALAAATAFAALDGLRREMAPLLAERWGEEWEWRQRDIEDVVNLAATQGTVEDFLRMVTIDVAIDKKSEAARAQLDDEKPLTVTTVHAAKGLEWDAVFIPSFVSGHMPSLYAEPGEGDEEEKRLFYVAVTRARKDLYFMRTATTVSKGMPVMVSESAFQGLIAPHVETQHAAPAKSGRSLELQTDAVISGW